MVMTKNIDVYLVRHGEASVPWSKGQDAGLSPLGLQQAEAVAAKLAQLNFRQVISSPLLRARQTAIPLGHQWGVSIQIDERYCEVPLASDTDKRKAWLVDVMKSGWRDVDSSILEWRSAAWDALQEIDQSAVIFTHFMLINAIVTRAIKDERLVCFEPDYVSMTHLQLTPDACRLVAMGNAINPL